MCHVAVEWMNDRELHRTDRESLDEDSSGLRIEILDLGSKYCDDVAYGSLSRTKEVDERNFLKKI